MLAVGDNGVGLPPEVDWRAPKSFGLQSVDLWARLRPSRIVERINRTTEVLKVEQAVI